VVHEDLVVYLQHQLAVLSVALRDLMKRLISALVAIPRRSSRVIGRCLVTVLTLGTLAAPVAEVEEPTCARAIL
jgi:hypothetical protein